jgi:myo-inositol-1(or 4)-monophosphatase
MPPMKSPSTALGADWLGACRAAARGLEEVLAASPTSAERIEETGTRGEGGDRTLVIDARAEDVVFGELDRLHDEGVRFTAISEERGVVEYGDDDLRVVIDPIDGSLNAKRGMPSHALSIAVADGPTMADVAFGFVHDFGTNEEWLARRGEGAWLDGKRIAPAAERRMRDGRLEMITLESTDPRWMAPAIEQLSATVHRVRALGSIAISLCQVAPARVDGMMTLWRTRSVDVAAAQLIVRETGGLVEFPAFDDPLAAPLDLEPHSPVVSARSAEGLAQLRSVLTAPGGHGRASRPK